MSSFITCADHTLKILIIRSSNIVAITYANLNYDPFVRLARESVMPQRAALCLECKPCGLSSLRISPLTDRLSLIAFITKQTLQWPHPRMRQAATCERPANGESRVPKQNYIDS